MPQSAACGVLLVEDEPGIRNALSSQLRGAGFEAEHAKVCLEGHEFPLPRHEVWFQKGVAQFPKLLEAAHDWIRNMPDPIIASQFGDAPLQTQTDGPDYFVMVLIPELGGLQALEHLRQVQPNLKVSMLSTANTRNVAQAIRLGSIDYPARQFQLANLEEVMQYPQTPQIGPCETLQLGHGIEELGDDLCFIGASPAMREIRAQVDQMASVNVPVLLLGESGTGKEIVARLIHQVSSRASRKFLKVNCAALPADLLESELFGYEAGAFTGADRSKPGKFEICDQGTILLDEIGEMPVTLQAKLLHVLQDQQFSRLGSRTTIQVDVRILAATNVNIEEAIAAKTLREDLYYRLNAFTLNLPPLRERREEIPLLLTQFMTRFARQYSRTPLPLSPRLVDACVQYSWPGNLRELENFVKRYLVLGDESLVPAELQTRMNESEEVSPEAGPGAGPLAGGLKSWVSGLKIKAEMQAIIHTLEETRWNRKQAAKILGIGYKSLAYKIARYGIK
jgi:two-component system, NtrC family, response regulator AtoC